MTTTELQWSSVVKVVVQAPLTAVKGLLQFQFETDVDESLWSLSLDWLPAPASVPITAGHPVITPYLQSSTKSQDYGLSKEPFIARLLSLYFDRISYYISEAWWQNRPLNLQDYSLVLDPVSGVFHLRNPYQPDSLLPSPHDRMKLVIAVSRKDQK